VALSTYFKYDISEFVARGLHLLGSTGASSVTTIALKPLLSAVLMS